MKKTGLKMKVLVLVAIAAVILMLFVQALLPVFAVSPPNIISYQGRVLNTAGVPLTASSASMIFRFYTASSGGTCLWSNSSASCATSTAMTVTLTDGLFSVNLGDTSASFAAIGDSVFADNAAVYLDVTIGGETLSPRRQVVAAPYALNAENLDGFDSSQVGGSNAFVPVTDASGNLLLTGTLTSGDFACTDCLDFAEFGDSLTLDAATSITGVAGRVFSWSRTLTNATAENGLSLSVVALDTTSATSAQYGLQITNAASTEGLDALLQLNNADTDDTVAAAIDITSAAGTILRGIDFNDTDIVTDMQLQNDETIDNNVDGTIAFGVSGASELNLTASALAAAVDSGLDLGSSSSQFADLYLDGGQLFADNAFDIDVDDNTASAFTVSEGSTNYILLTTTNSAEVLALGATGLTQMTLTTDNNANNDLNIIGGTTFNDDVIITAGAGEVFSVNRTLTNATAESAMSVTVTASDTTSSTTSQGGLFIDNAASTEAVDGLLTLNNADDDDVVGAGVLFSAGGTGTDFLYGMDFDAANIGTADIRFENSGTLDEATLGTWTFDRSTAGTVTLQATDDDTTTALTISSSGTGLLTLDPTGAGSIAFGSADVTAMTFASDNNANFDFSFTGGATFNDDVNIISGASEVFSVVRTLTDATAENSMALSVTASDTTSSTIQQNGLIIDNLASTEALDAMIVLNNSDADDTVGAGIFFSAGAAGTDFTYGIDFDAANIGTADIRFENSGTLDEATLGIWTFDRSTAGTVTLQATDDDLTTALTVSSSGTGLLTLDPTGAGSIALGSTDVTSISFTTDSNAATDLSFTGGTTFNADSLLATNGVLVSADGLTTGFGLMVERADSAVDFDGANPGAGGLVYINQANDNATSDAEALFIRNLGGGASTGFFLVQNGVDAPAANTVSQQAMVLDVNEAAGDVPGTDEDVFTIRSDADGTPDTEFKIQLDGDIAYDGTASSPASDLAEVYPSNDVLVAGDVVVLDTSDPGKIKKSSTSYEANLFGAISTKPAVRMGSDFVGYDVALSGRISLKVSAENGAIAVGDPLTSSSTAGYAMKATEPGMIVGRALEAQASGLGTIMAFVDAEWYAGNVLTSDGSSSIMNDTLQFSSLGSASASKSYGSNLLTFRGSGWDGVAKAETSMSMGLAVVNGSAAARLSFTNAGGAEVAYLSSEGSFAFSGRIYPSDRGALQSSKYIYYDGSSGPAGDFMRTNAAGWATGSYDFAEMFASSEALVPGDVVMLTTDNLGVRRSFGSYEPKLAGVVSTRPGFLAGENSAGSYPIALAGRVPTNVSSEGGAIIVGDPLTSSSSAGYAMKATQSGTIIGYALQPFDGDKGSILTFVRPGWYDDGVATTPLVGTDNAASQISPSATSSTDAIATRQIESLLGNWSIAEDGTFQTHLTSAQGNRTTVYALMSPEVTLTLSGTATLENGSATILFDEIAPNFKDLVSPTVPMRILVTASGPIGPLFVSHREQNGFTVGEVGGSSTGVEFDWLVIAYRAGYEPVEGTEGTVPVTSALPEDTSDPSSPIEQTVVEEEPTFEGEQVVEVPATTMDFVVDGTLEAAPLQVIETQPSAADAVE